MTEHYFSRCLGAYVIPIDNVLSGRGAVDGEVVEEASRMAMRSCS